MLKISKDVFVRLTRTSLENTDGHINLKVNNFTWRAITQVTSLEIYCFYCPCLKLAENAANNNANINSTQPY